MTIKSNAPRVVVAGFGSVDRGDDGVGPLVASLIATAEVVARDVGPLSDPLDLLGQWNCAELAVIVDAVRSGAPLGTVHVLDMNLDAGSPGSGALDTNTMASLTSTHGIGLAGVIRLARAVGQLPHRLVVVGVEGGQFGYGDEISPAVKSAVPDAVQRVQQLIREVTSCA